MPASEQEIQGIKVVALDIYGTVLPSDDFENNAKPRPGLVSFFDKCDSKEIKVVTASDAFIPNVRNHLSNCFRKHPEKGLSLYRFNDFFHLVDSPKDFSIILGYYSLIPKELLVIGDNPKKDIEGAAKLGCLSILVPQYRLDTSTEFDFSKIQI